MEQELLQLHNKRMRSQALENFSSRIAWGDVRMTCHISTLKQAVSNVLSTELSISTFAQIIDGLPVADVAWDRRYPGLHYDHPIDDHEELCSGCEDRAREFYHGWDPNMLKFNPKTVMAFQQSRRGSKAFHLRLIELVATALHQIGSTLYQLDLRLHQGDVDSIIFWRYPEQPADSELRPTLFYHPMYVDADVYPEGVADMVGYWAEDRILGGVVSFDRRDPNLTAMSDDELPNAYMLSSRERITSRVWQLRDEQQDALIKFLLAKPEKPEPCPLPILPDRTNRIRVDDYTPLASSKIYRDEWERKPVTREEWNFRQKRPRDELDYPEARELIYHVNRQLGIPIPARQEDGPSSSPAAREQSQGPIP